MLVEHCGFDSRIEAARIGIQLAQESELAPDLEGVRSWLDTVIVSPKASEKRDTLPKMQRRNSLAHSPYPG